LNVYSIYVTNATKLVTFLLLHRPVLLQATYQASVFVATGSNTESSSKNDLQSPYQTTNNIYTENVLEISY